MQLGRIERDMRAVERFPDSVQNDGERKHTGRGTGRPAALPSVSEGPWPTPYHRHEQCQRKPGWAGRAAERERRAAESREGPPARRHRSLTPHAQ